MVFSAEAAMATAIGIFLRSRDARRVGSIPGAANRFFACALTMSAKPPKSLLLITDIANSSFLHTRDPIQDHSQGLGCDVSQKAVHKKARAVTAGVVWIGLSEDRRCDPSLEQGEGNAMLEAPAGLDRNGHDLTI